MGIGALDVGALVFPIYGMCEFLYHWEKAQPSSLAHLGWSLSDMAGLVVRFHPRKPH